MSLTSASSSSASASPSVTASLTALCSVLRRPISASMSSSAATATRQSSAGRDLDVVDREHVGRVGHRDEQGLLVDEADRQRPVAARGVDRDQVRRRHVDLVDGEVDVVEAVALGDGAGELVGVDRPLLEQQLLGRRPGGAGLFDRLAGAVFGDEAEVDEDVGDEAARAAAGDAAASGRACRRLRARGPARSSRRSRGPAAGGSGSPASPCSRVVVERGALVAGVDHCLDDALPALEAVADRGGGDRLVRGAWAARRPAPGRG